MRASAKLPKVVIVSLQDPKGPGIVVEIQTRRISASHFTTEYCFGGATGVDAWNKSVRLRADSVLKQHSLTAEML